MKLLYKGLAILSLYFTMNCQEKIRYFSQPPVNQDRYMNERVFHNKTGGTFIDIGAHDGVTYSNSYFFEKYLNWNGICFEPLPDQFDKLKNARKCVCINAAVSDTEGFAEFVRAYGTATEHTEMLSGLKSTYAPEHFARLQTEIERDGGKFEVVKVPVVKLNDVLKKNNITFVDYLSIDTEGHELPILESIDFNTYTICAITVENNYDDDSILNFLTSKGFKRVAKIDSDEFYINEDYVSKHKISVDSFDTRQNEPAQVNMSDPRLLIKIPTRSRPQRLFKVLDKFYENLSGEIPYKFLISCDEDDATMNNPSVIEKLRSYPNLYYYFGRSGSKIDAYNRDIDDVKKLFDFDILCVASDDLEPVVSAFDVTIVSQILSRFPDYDGVLRFSNEFYLSKANIYPVIGRKFYDRFGYIYFPEYQTAYCDDELTAVAELLHKDYPIDIILMRHDHPIFGRATMDELYVKNENRQLYKHDYDLFQARKARGFDINTTMRSADYWQKRFKAIDTSVDEKVWSILICTLNDRQSSFEYIYNKLKKQIGGAHLQDKIEIIFERDNYEKSIGCKRNMLLEKSRGKYICFVDDDDDVCDNYITMIYNKLLSNADCVSLMGEMTVDGKNKRTFIHSIKYDHYFEDDHVYYRPPNHLNPIKRSIALQEPFPEKYHGEDTEWAMKLVKRGLIKTELSIDVPYYFYNYKRK